MKIVIVIAAVRRLGRCWYVPTVRQGQTRGLPQRPRPRLQADQLRA